MFVVLLILSGSSNSIIFSLLSSCIEAYKKTSMRSTFGDPLVEWKISITSSCNIVEEDHPNEVVLQSIRISVLGNYIFSLKNLAISIVAFNKVVFSIEEDLYEVFL